MPDHQAAQDLPGAAPLPQQLAKARHQHRHGAHQQPLPGPAPGRRRGQVGLKAPEGPEKGQPVGQPQPGQPATAGPQTAQQHQQGGGQQQAVDGIAPGARAAAAALDQGQQQQQGAQQGTAGQQRQPQLKTAPAEGIGARGTLPQQLAIDCHQASAGGVAQGVAQGGGQGGGGGQG